MCNNYFISIKETTSKTVIFFFLFKQKVRRSISDDVHLRQIVNPTDNTQAVKSVDYVTDFKKLTEKFDEIQRLIDTRVMDADLIKYLPTLAELVYQDMLYAIKNKKSSCRFNIQRF